MKGRVRAGYPMWDRPIDELNYITDRNGHIRTWDSEEEAIQALRGEGFPADSLVLLEFEKVEGEDPV